MKKLPLRIAALAVILAALLPALLSADGILWPRRTGFEDLLSQKAQNAWVEWKGGRERMTIAVEPMDVAPRVAWLIPVPARAKDVRLELIKDSPVWKGEEVRAKALFNIQFLAIFGYFAVMALLFYWRGEGVIVLIVLGCLSSIAIPKFGVKTDSEIIPETFAHVELGGLTSELVEIRSVAGLRSYLRERSCELPGGSSKILEELIREKHSFILSWATRPKLEHSLAVRASFPAERPFYPMRLTSAYGKKRIAVDLRVSGWIPPPRTLIDSGVKVGFYRDSSTRKRHTRVVYDGLAGDMDTDWSFGPPRRFSPILTFAASMGDYPFTSHMLIFVLAGLASGLLGGWLAFPFLRGPMGVPPRAVLGLSFVFPFFGPALALYFLTGKDHWIGPRRGQLFLPHVLCFGLIFGAWLTLTEGWSLRDAPVRVAWGGSGLVRKSYEGATKGNLGAIRSALSIYYGDMEGLYPADPVSLTQSGKWLSKIPPAALPPYHERSRIISRLTGKEFASGRYMESGGWAYVTDGTDRGRFFVNCTHTDSKGHVWSEY